MKKSILLTSMLGLALLASACSRISTPPTATQQTPAASATSVPQAAGTATQSTPPPATTSTAQAGPLLLDQCSLLNSRDLASLYSSAEVVLPQPKTSQVAHVIFSNEKIPAKETSCTYYVFHKPGKADSQMLQITYWIDAPNQVKPDTWAQLWSDTTANLKGKQAVTGFGNGAFFNRGRLTFKKDNVYVTIEAIGTELNTSTDAGAAQQLQIEKQVAQDAFNRMG